jgi:hypothetical protein
MVWLMRLFAVIYSAISFFFAAASVVLVIRAVATLWHAATQSPTQVSQVIESIGILQSLLLRLRLPRR